MAAIASPWRKPGAWALDSEAEGEANNQKFLEQGKKSGNDDTEFIPEAEPPAEFPSLAEAAATKTSKKKKGHTMPLGKFNADVSSSNGSARMGLSGISNSLTPDELMILPTGSRERTAEELDRSRLGGGFRSYGSSGYDSSRNRYSEGYDETRKQGGGFDRDSAPSRADETDDWGAVKKAPVAGLGYENRERGVGFPDSHSRADDSDSWVSKKSSAPFEGRRFGSSDRDSKAGFESFSRESSNGQGLESGPWGRRRDDGGAGNAGGDGGSLGRPKLNLQPRTLPIDNGNQGQSSVVKPKGLNLFGEARPREEVLAKKGQDWKKIDEHLESVKINETEVASNVKRFDRWNSGLSNSSVKTERSWRVERTVDARDSSVKKEESSEEI